LFDLNDNALSWHGVADHHDSTLIYTYSSTIVAVAFNVDFYRIGQFLRFLGGPSFSQLL
jgi:hypothetical protein